MKIQLTTDLPINITHGAKKGVVFEVFKYDQVKDLYYFKGAQGLECGAYGSECKVTEESVVETKNKHSWEKTNNVTVWEGKRSLDKFRCKLCSCTAKMYVLGEIQQDGRYSQYCKGK